MSDYTCVLCGPITGAAIAIHPDFRTDIFECAKCGLMQSEAIFPSNLTEYYRKQYRYERGEGLTPRYHEFMDARGQAQAKFIHQQTRTQQFDDALEIGCGIGRLLFNLEAASKHFTESDPQFATHARDVLGNDAFLDESDLESEEYSGQFDLVVLSHVFEHFTDPLSTLDQIFALLRERGFVFIEVPNENVVTIAQTKTGNGHLSFFQQGSFRHLIDAHQGFELEGLSFAGITLEEYLGGASLDLIEDRPEEDNRVWMRAILKKRQTDLPARAPVERFTSAYFEKFQRRAFDQFQRYREDAAMLPQLEKQLSELQERLSDANIRFRDLDKAYKDAKENVSKQHAAIVELQHELDLASTEVEALKAVRDAHFSLTANLKEMTKRTEQFANLKEEVETLKHKYADSQRLVSELRRQLRD